ncbi:hypothetical protein [Micromonospora sp. NPDC005652]|uniref:hypothetical protein n=1 Tax=Micromonospora sp. NPDC005652 TaxID=3157046 RepID=UPI0033E8B73E
MSQPTQNNDNADAARSTAPMVDEMHRVAGLIDAGDVAGAAQALEVAEEQGADKQISDALRSKLAERAVEVSELAEIERLIDGQKVGMNRANAIVDALAPLREQARRQLRVAQDLAGSKATAATRAAIEENQRVIAIVDQIINKCSGLIAAGLEQNQAAHAGLEPVRQAQQELHRAGATVELLLPQTA